MFGMLASLAKSAVAVVATPVAAAIDIGEATGIMRDSGRNRTEESLEAALKNLEKAFNPSK